MSRQPRAGTAGKLVGIRASDAERSWWEAAAKHAGADLSSWLRQAAYELVDSGKERKRGWMRPVREPTLNERAARAAPSKARRSGR